MDSNQWNLIMTKDPFDNREQVYTNIVNYLKDHDHGPDEIRDIAGSTLLHDCIWTMNVPAVKLLLDKGANPYIKNIHGNGTLHNWLLNIKKEENFEIFKILMSKMHFTKSDVSFLIHRTALANVARIFKMISALATQEDLDDAINYTNTEEIKILCGHKITEESKTFINVINKCHGYCFETKTFHDDAEELMLLAKNTKIQKDLKAYGYHGGSFKLQGPVSVLDVLKNCHKFVCKGLDHYRNVNRVHIHSDTKNRLRLDITVDNFST